MGDGPGQGSFLVLGGLLVDGDVDAEGTEPAEVVADLLVAVGLAGVPVGAEVDKARPWVLQQVPVRR